MTSRLLMVASATVLGLMGVATLFLPQEIVAALGLPTADPLPILTQLIGATYFSFALINWMAKSNAIGGIYSRPLSIGNFSHFFIGALILGQYQLANPLDGVILTALTIYTIFAILFWWLAFKHSGFTNSWDKSN